MGTNPRFSLMQTKGAASKLAPHVVILSSALVENLDVVVIAPLRRLKTHGPLTRRLHVPVLFDGEQWVVVTEQLVSLSPSLLGKRVGSVENHREALVAALDFLFQGY